jgi:hypothetical protein
MKVAPSHEILTSAAGDVFSLNRWLAMNLGEIAAVTEGSPGSTGTARREQLTLVPGPKAAESAAAGSFSIAARRAFPTASKSKVEQRT